MGIQVAAAGPPNMKCVDRRLEVAIQALAVATANATRDHRVNWRGIFTTCLLANWSSILRATATGILGTRCCSTKDARGEMARIIMNMRVVNNVRSARVVHQKKADDTWNLGAFFR